MSTTETYLLALTIIFSVPYLVWRLGRTDYWAPLVVVQIIGGVLLGPGVLGKFSPDTYRFVFTAPVVQLLGGIATWGVMSFVWIAGIELDLRRAWAHRGESVLTAGLALGTPLVFGCIAAFGLLGSAGWIGPKARSWQFVVGVGMACAVTALPVLILLLDKMAVLRLPIGQRILRYASFDDVAIWGVLALILMDWERVGKQIGFLVAFAALTVAVPQADAQHPAVRPLVRRRRLARPVRLRRRLERHALHGRRLPRRHAVTDSGDGSTKSRWTPCASTSCCC